QKEFEWQARATRVPRPGSAERAIAARIGRTVFLQRTTCQSASRFARGPNGGLELFKKNRSGKIKTLRVADFAGGLEIGELLEGFDALGNDGHAECFAQRFDRPQNSLAARTFMNVGDEGPVDLDFVGGDVGQRRERRIADAEIVDRDSDPEVAEDRQDLVLEMSLCDES